MKSGRISGRNSQDHMFCWKLLKKRELLGKKIHPEVISTRALLKSCGLVTVGVCHLIAADQGALGTSECSHLNLHFSASGGGGLGNLRTGRFISANSDLLRVEDKTPNPFPGKQRAVFQEDI